MAETPPLREPTFFVLTALLPGPLHGYGIIKAVEEMSDGRVTLRAGTLYAALERLENAQAVALDREESEGGPPRRYYRLTDWASRCWRPRASASPTTRGSSRTASGGCGRRDRAQRHGERERAGPRRHGERAGDVTQCLFKAAARLVVARDPDHGAEIVATAAGGRDRRRGGDRGAREPRRLRSAARAARARSGSRARWSPAALVALAALTPVALGLPFALLVLGLRDARAAAAATLFWLWRLVTADVAELVDALGTPRRCAGR